MDVDYLGFLGMRPLVILGVAGSVASLLSLLFIPAVGEGAQAAASWLWTDHPHSLVVILGIVISLLVLLVVRMSRTASRAGRSSAETTRPADVRLWREFLDILSPDSDFIYLIRNHNFGLPFKWATVEPLESFVHGWDDAAHEFLDSEIEERRRQLHLVAYEFLAALGAQTFPLDQRPDRQSVPGDWKRSPNPVMREQFKEFMNNLNAKAAAVWDSYESLVRTARGRLGV